MASIHVHQLERVHVTTYLQGRLTNALFSWVAVQQTSQHGRRDFADRAW